MSASDGRLRLPLFFAASAVAIGAAVVLDRPFYRAMEQLGGLRSVPFDTYILFRLAGFLPTWILVAAAMVLIDTAKRSAGGLRAVFERGGLLLTSATLSGVLGEVLKVLVRRERPDAHDGLWVFRAFSERTFDASNLALPSSHAAVAFGAAFMLCRLHPRAAPVWLLLAAGCAATRLVVNSHFLSDVVAAALLGFAVAWSLWLIRARRTGADQTTG